MILPPGRQERRLGVFLLEVFEDRERLEQPRPAVDQRRHHHLRVDRAVLWRELVAALQMEVHIVAAEPFKVERDAHAETRLRAVIGIELHRRPLVRIPAGFGPTSAAGCYNFATGARKIASTFAAASSCSRSIVCEYRSSVKETEWCPSRSCATFG